MRFALSHNTRGSSYVRYADSIIDHNDAEIL